MVSNNLKLLFVLLDELEQAVVMVCPPLGSVNTNRPTSLSVHKNRVLVRDEQRCEEISVR